jgi:hypothetical protein
MTLTDESTEPAQAGYERLLAAALESGELVRGERGGETAADRAAGYTYALELLRLAIDFYADQDWSNPRFIPFSSPLSNHTGDLPIKRIQGGVNPDGYYDFAVINPSRSYRITGTRGNDCYLSFSFSGGIDGEWPERTAATLNHRAMTFDDDGGFTVTIASDATGPNAIVMEPDMCSVIVRQYFNVPPEDRHLAQLRIEVDPAGDEPLSETEQVGRSLTAAAAFVRSTNAHFPFPKGLADNYFTEPLGYTGDAGALGTTDNCYCMGRWKLAPGEELVVETTPARSGYWSLQIWNHWGQSVNLTLDEAPYPQLIVNHAQATLNADGSVRIVVSPEAPDAPNWLKTFGWTEGVMIFRYLFPEERPARPEVTIKAVGPAK